MEKTVRFETYKKMRDHALAVCDGPLPDVDPHLIKPIELAYIGDAVFSLYVRKRLLPVSGHVQVLHDLAARMVSAVMQAKAMDGIEPQLTEAEAVVVRRGRNTKSTVPKSATVREYRQGTAFEALMGWLYLTGETARLEILMKASFTLIQQAMMNEKRG